MKRFLVFAFTLLSIIHPAISLSQTKDGTETVLNFVKAFNSKDSVRLRTFYSTSYLNQVNWPKQLKFLLNMREDFGVVEETIKIDVAKNRLAQYARNADKLVAYIIRSSQKNYLMILAEFDSDLKFNRFILRDPNFNDFLPETHNHAKLVLPFDEVWTVLHGGDEEDQNYHVSVRSQKNAFDLIITDTSGKSHKGSGKENKEYYAFGKKLYSPCKGIVVKVINNVMENKPGEMNPKQLTGNTVIIKAGKNEYVLMAHFMNESIVVKEGQMVKSGQYLGLCGNSGNSSEPHLHLHLMDGPVLNEGTGIKCFFKNITVIKNNKKIFYKLYSPVKDDLITNKK